MPTSAERDAIYESLVRQSQGVAYYPLDYSGFADIIGGDHFNSFPARLTWGADEFGQFLELNNQIISAPPPSVALNNFSIELWVKVLQATTAGHTLVSNGAPGGNGYEIETLGTPGNGTWRVFLGGVGNLATSGGALIRGKWCHIVVVRDANTWKYYVDGTLMHGTAGTAAPTTPTIMQLGALPSGRNQFKKLAFYERVLTPAEILQRNVLMNSIDSLPVSLDVGIAAANTDAETVYLKLTPSSTDIADTLDTAEVYFNLVASGTEFKEAVDSATVYMDLDVHGGECYSTFSGLMFGEGDAEPRWFGDGEPRWIGDAEPRWGPGEATREGINC